MNSPCREHFQRITAEKAAKAAGPGEQIVGGEYERMLVRLRSDLQRLKDIESVERKADYKAKILPAYVAWVDGVLAADSGAEDDVLPNVMVWRIDAGDARGALNIGDYVLRHGLKMPDRYNRGAATVLAEEIAEQAIKAVKAGRRADPAVLFDTLTVTAERDMPDEARAKLLKAYGWAMTPPMEGEADAEQVMDAMTAVAVLRRAEQLSKKAGVRRDIENLERYLKRNDATVKAIEAKSLAVAQESSESTTETTAAPTGDGTTDATEKSDTPDCAPAKDGPSAPEGSPPV